MLSKRISVFVILLLSSFVTVNCQGWNIYIEQNLIAGGLAHAAIVGIDGTIWAKSANFIATVYEILDIYNGFSDSYPLRTNGLFLNSEKYLVLKADDLSIYSKKGSGGAICVKTEQAIIIGIYNDQLQPGAAASLVEKLAEFLRDQGY